jgi:hypothetical protein
MSITISNDDASKLTIKGSGKLIIKTAMELVGSKTELPVSIEADFTNIPIELHYLYYQMLVSQYNTRQMVHSSLYDKEEPKTIKEKKSEWRLNRIVDIISKGLKLK